MEEEIGQVLFLLLLLLLLLSFHLHVGCLTESYCRRVSSQAKTLEKEGYSGKKTGVYGWPFRENGRGWPPLVVGAAIKYPERGR